MQTKLKKRRETLGLTQSEVAVAAGVTVRCYQYYETGVKKPTVDIAIKISKKLQATVEEVFIID